MMPDRSLSNVGLLLLRGGVGGTLVAHGTQNLFGWFGGPGFTKLAATFDKVGFTPGKMNAIAACAGTVGTGTALIVGAATPAAAAGSVGTMAVAASLLAEHGFFASKGGLELPALLAVSSAALALTGPGAISVDAVLGHRLDREWMALFALAAVTPAAILVIARRRRATMMQNSSSNTSSTNLTTSPDERTSPDD